MPLGQTHGAMGIFAYESDDGNTYNLRLDAEDGVQGGLTAAARGANPAYPGGNVARHCWVQSAAGNRKRLVCTQLIGTAIGSTIVIDAVNYIVTGYVGEKISPRV